MMFLDITFKFFASSLTMDGYPYYGMQHSDDSSGNAIPPTISFFGIHTDRCVTGMDVSAGSPFHSHLLGKCHLNSLRHWSLPDCGTTQLIQRPFHSKHFDDLDFSSALLSPELPGSSFFAITDSQLS